MDGPVERGQDRKPDPEAHRLWKRWRRTIGLGVLFAILNIGLFVLYRVAYRSHTFEQVSVIGALLCWLMTAVAPLYAWRFAVRPAWVRWLVPPIVGASLSIGSVAISIRTMPETRVQRDAHYAQLAREIAAHLANPGDRHDPLALELRYFTPTPKFLPFDERPDPYVARHISGMMGLKRNKSGAWRLRYTPRGSESVDGCVFSDQCVVGRCGRLDDPGIERPC